MLYVCSSYSGTAVSLEFLKRPPTPTLYTHIIKYVQIPIFASIDFFFFLILCFPFEALKTDGGTPSFAFFLSFHNTWLNILQNRHGADRQAHILSHESELVKHLSWQKEASRRPKQQEHSIRNNNL